MKNIDIITSGIKKSAERLGYGVSFDEVGNVDYVRTLNRDLPEISGGPNSWGDDKRWKIQTVSHGSVSPEEIDAMIEGLRKAQQMVAVLDAYCGE